MHYLATHLSAMELSSFNMYITGRSAMGQLLRIGSLTKDNHR